ncbi:MAG: DUF305 domain-containing protein [Candidatus Humimicrobiaceae bacterium]
MRKDKGLLTVSIILIALGLIGTMFLGLISDSFNQTMVKGFSRSMMSGIDRHFIEQMIPHHEDAVLMAEMALAKAEHEELKQLAEEVRDNQSKEIDDMRAWYKSWFESEVRKSSAGSSNMMEDMTDLESLESARLFDKEFIEQMIPHHQMAIMMASMLLNRTERDEMKQLAQNIIKTQTEEINRMSLWYEQWY